MLKEETIEFLKSVPPFNFLSEDDLNEIADEISLEYYPKGIKILSQNGPPADFLRLIKKGGVKVYLVSDEGEEIPIDYRSEGEQFGIVSVVSGDRSRANIIAVEDTICYLISRDHVMNILEKHSKVNEYFVKSFFLNLIDKTYEETRKRHFLIGEGDRVLFTTPVRDIIRKEPVTASENMSIKNAGALMAREQISSLIIVNEAGVPAGIITDRDLREKVVAKGRDVQDEVHLIMSSPLIRIDAGEYCFEALLRMIRYNIHHLLVIDGGELKGVVTNHDFMVLQGSSPTVFVKEIEEAQDVAELAAAKPKFIKVVSELLREGARASNVTGLITELSEKFVNRAVDFTERKLGPSPLPFTLFLYSSSARRELTLTLRIRLGVIFADSANVGILEKTRRYFEEFSRVLIENLRQSGFSEREVIMRPDYLKSAAEWTASFDKAAKRPFEADWMDEGLFEMRSIRGDESFVKELQEHAENMAAKSEELMDYLATKTVQNRPPLGFFKRFVVEKSGEHKNELNLFAKGIKPIVDAIRVFSLEKQTHELSTFKRLQVLRDRYSFSEANDAAQALEYLFTLVIHDQIGHTENGTPIDSFMNPEFLSSLEKKTVKEAFVLIARLYDIIEKGYRTERQESIERRSA